MQETVFDFFNIEENGALRRDEAPLRLVRRVITEPFGVQMIIEEFIRPQVSPASPPLNAQQRP